MGRVSNLEARQDELGTELATLVEERDSLRDQVKERQTEKEKLTAQTEILQVEDY